MSPTPLLSTRPGWFQHRRDEEGISPSRRVSIHADATRRGIPSSRCVFIRTAPTSRGIPPLVVFLSAQTRRGGDLPFLACFYPRRRNVEGYTYPLHRVSIRTDTARGASRHDEREYTPSRRISIRTDATRRAHPPPRHLLYYILIYFNYNYYS